MAQIAKIEQGFEIMKILLSLIIVLLLFASCASNPAETSSPEANQMVECEKAVREYFSTTSKEKTYGDATPRPPMKVFGVSYFKRINPSTLVLRVDAETPDGKRETISVRCVEFTGQGKTYWKIEPSVRGDY